MCKPDRAQIGNARVLQAGTSSNILQALNLVGRDFNWVGAVLQENSPPPLTGYAKIIRYSLPSFSLPLFRGNKAVSITYIPVLLFIIPSNLVVKQFSAKYYLPAVMVLFGGISRVFACIALIDNGVLNRFAGLLLHTFGKF